jgi:TctA family transporter
MDSIISGVSYLANPAYWAVLSAAIVLAGISAIIPGLSSIMFMALAIPFVLLNIKDPIIGLTFLAAMSGVSNTLDSLPAIILGTPSASTQVTFLEGNKLAQRGEAAYTLGAVYAVSAMGGIIGAIALLIIIPVIKPFVLSFSYSEIAATALFGVGMVSALSRGAMLKGLMAGVFGILLGTVGVDPITGVERYTFGQLQLWTGLPLIATTLGLFALPEMIDLTITRKSLAPKSSVISTREVFRGTKEGFRRWKSVIRQSLFGVFLGAVPGIGASVIDWLSYVFGIFFTKDKSQFGKGSLEGLLFAESAQNSKEGGQAVPTLALGIPGGITWALILTAMLGYNIAPGPEMLGRHADLTISLVLTLALANLGITALALVGSGQLIRLTKVPYPIIGAVVIPVSLMAAFVDMTNWRAIPIVFTFAGVGLAMKMLSWPRPPMILGVILGPIIELNFHASVTVHGLVGTATRPLTLVLFLLAVLLSYLFYRMGQASAQIATTEAAPQAVGAQATGSGSTPPEGPNAGGRRRLSPPTLTQWDTFMAIGVMAAAGAVLWGSLEFTDRARFLPMWLSIFVIVLGVVHLARQYLRMGSGQVEIMDIGMRSIGAEGAGRTGALLAGLLGLFVLVSMLAGFRYGSMAFAFMLPLVMMQGKMRWIGAVIGVSLVGGFTVVVLDRLAAVAWPEPVLWSWIQSTLLR